MQDGDGETSTPAVLSPTSTPKVRHRAIAASSSSSRKPEDLRHGPRRPGFPGAVPRPRRARSGNPSSGRGCPLRLTARRRATSILAHLQVYPRRRVPRFRSLRADANAQLALGRARTSDGRPRRSRFPGRARWPGSTRSPAMVRTGAPCERSDWSVSTADLLQEVHVASTGDVAGLSLDGDKETARSSCPRSGSTSRRRSPRSRWARPT